MKLPRNREHVLRTRTEIQRPIAEVFDFFGAAENLEIITPPELRFRIVTPLPITIAQGTRIDYRLSLFGLSFAWQTEITRWQPPFEFVDEQVKGPYAQWIHRHTFEAVGDRTVIEDEVRYRLPVPLVGDIALPIIKLQLRRIFGYRERRMRELLA